MFGFSNPGTFALDYRSLYSRMCQHHRHHNGLFATLFHSYEAVLLYSAAWDAGLFPKTTVPQQQCCHLRSIRQYDCQPDKFVGQYCASVASLLARVKLEDDVKDDKSVFAYVALKLWNKRFQCTSEFFNVSVPGLMDQIIGHVRNHHELEESNSRIELATYLVPTAESFAAVFRGLPSWLKNESLEKTFHDIGFHLGAAIIAFDCCADWRRDQKTGSYNPVSNEGEAIEAFALGVEHLEDLKGRIPGAISTDSMVRRIVDAVLQRVQNVAGLLDRQRPTAWAMLKQVWHHQEALNPFHDPKTATLFCVDPASLAIGHLCCFSGALGACCCGNTAKTGNPCDGVGE